MDYTHPDLFGKVLPGFNFVSNTGNTYDDNGHGTHVAGIAAAVNNNATGVHGMCPDCMVLPVKVLDGTGSGTWFEIMAGIDYADQTIDQLGGAPGTKGILSMSLGGMADPNDPAYVEMAALINSVAANNKLIAVAAGNDNDATYTYCKVPANAASCGGYLTYIPAAMVKAQTSGLSVAASNPNDYRAYFSNSNPAYTNIIAPGRFIWSSLPYDSYDAWDGTSMATPLVSGTAGRVWITYPAYTAEQIVSKLRSNAVTNQLGTARGYAATLPRLDVAFSTASQICSITGYVVNPEVGEWGVNQGLSQPINRVTVTVKDTSTNPATVIATAQTNATGFFTATGTLACGSSGKTYSLTYTKLGYVTMSQNVSTVSDTTSATVNAPPVFMPISRTAVAPFDEMLVTLEWSSVDPASPACSAGTGSCTDATNKGAELDLYLNRPDGTTVSYTSVGDIYGAYTRDSYVDYMPGEAVYIKDLMTGGSNTYTIAVNRPYWGNMPTVGARVKIYKGPALAANYLVPAACGTAGTDDWWTVATIDATTKVITPVTTTPCSGIAPF